MFDPGTYNDWTIYEGAAFAKSFSCPGIASAVGYSARMDIRNAKRPTADLILSLTTDNGRIALTSNGTRLIVALSLIAPDTVDLDFSQGFYDIEIVPPAGEDATWRALEGTIAYSRNATAAP